MIIKPGQLIGDYEVLGLLGSGGMGRVYKVRNLLSGRVEALKILRTDGDVSPELQERFMREIKVHAALEHPNIAHLRTALRVEQRLVMVMELVGGISLEARLANGPLPLAESISYASQVLSALAYAHQQNVVHRDIKPANIMVTPQGTVKLMDFGIAMGAVSQKFTQTGMAVGSLYYMSPEQVSARPVDSRSDLYSLGVTLYEMTTGIRPIDGDSEYTIMDAHLHAIPVAPNTLDNRIPLPVSAAILKALAKDRTDRFQTADEFRRTLGGSETGTGELPEVPAGRFEPNAWDVKVLDEARGRLANYLGPVAKILVSRAAKKTATVEQLYQALAVDIESAKDREQFLASRPVRR